jgi:hypothetical protein
MLWFQWSDSATGTVTTTGTTHPSATNMLHKALWCGWVFIGLLRWIWEWVLHVSWVLRLLVLGLDLAHGARAFFLLEQASQQLP